MKLTVPPRTVFLTLVLLASTVPLLAKNIPEVKTSAYRGIAGADEARRRQYPDRQTYEYQKYLVTVKPRPENVGEDIRVVPRDPQRRDQPWTQANTEADYFLALYHDLLFQDRGTGPDRRELLIYDLKQPSRIYRTRYALPMKIDRGMLIFWRETGQPDPATVKAYQAKGLGGAAIETKVRLNLANFTLAKTRETRVAGRQ